MSEQKNQYVSDFKLNNSALIDLLSQFWNEKILIISTFVIVIILAFFLKYSLLPQTYVSETSIFPDNSVSFASKNPLNIKSQVSPKLYEYFPIPEHKRDDIYAKYDNLDPDRILNEFISLLKDKETLFANAKIFASNQENFDAKQMQTFSETASDNFYIFIDVSPGLNVLSKYVKVNFIYTDEQIAKDFLVFHITLASRNFNQLFVNERSYFYNSAINNLKSDIIRVKGELENLKNERTFKLSRIIETLNRDIKIATNLGITEPATSFPSVNPSDSFIQGKSGAEEFPSNFWKGTTVLKGEKEFLISQLDENSFNLAKKESEVTALESSLRILQDLSNQLSLNINYNFFNWSSNDISSRRNFMSDEKLFAISVFIGLIMSFFLVMFKIFRLN